MIQRVVPDAKWRSGELGGDGFACRQVLLAYVVLKAPR